MIHQNFKTLFGYSIVAITKTRCRHDTCMYNHCLFLVVLCPIIELCNLFMVDDMPLGVPIMTYSLCSELLMRLSQYIHLACGKKAKAFQLLWESNPIPFDHESSALALGQTANNKATLLFVCLIVLRPTIRLFALYLRSDGMSLGLSIMTL